jgi:hypothetical protein
MRSSSDPMLMPIQFVVPQTFQKAIYHTNYANIERNLLELDSFRTALRFALMDGFREDSPVITSLLQDLYRVMPSLFSTLLTVSENCSVMQALEGNIFLLVVFTRVVFYLILVFL